VGKVNRGSKGHPLRQKLKMIDQHISTVVPLWHFELRGGPLILDSHFSIRQLTIKERSILEESLGVYGTIHPDFGVEFVRKEYRPAMPSEKLGKDYKRALERWLSHVDIDSGYNRSTKVIEAMRLFTTGDVGTFFFMNIFRGGDHETGSPTEFGATGTGGTYVLTVELQKPFLAFWKIYSTLNTEKIHRHLDRFGRSYTQHDWYDRLVDFVTSLEGVVLPGQREEKRNQFALRIAWILGSTKSERERLFKEAIDIYDARSAVVHGELDVRSPKDFSICQRAEGLNRLLLVKAMEDPALFTKEKLKLVPLGM